jgi:hypothetical protein
MEADSVDYGADLAAAVDQMLPGWVVRTVRRFRDDLDLAAAAAGEEARRDVGARLRQLLETDLDQQRSNPLAILRTAIRYPTQVLAAAAVPGVVREPFAVEAFPEDIYNVSPATWSDIDPALQEYGITWSAWKAHEFLRRRRAEGKQV